MILVLYVMILSSTLEIVGRRKTEEELRFARQLISQQREHYNPVSYTHLYWLRLP